MLQVSVGPKRLQCEFVGNLRFFSNTAYVISPKFVVFDCHFSGGGGGRRNSSVECGIKKFFPFFTGSYRGLEFCE